MKYDFWIKNGRLIDPARGIEQQGDILIRNSRLMPFPESGEIDAEEVIDAQGYLVTPGLIDFHTHLAFRSSDIGLAPDLYMLPNGVTSAVDAGSGGTANFESLFHDTFASNALTTKSFLNVAATGIITEQYFETLDPACFDVKRMEYLFERYPHELLGLKVRIGKRFSKELGLRPLIAAAELSERFGCPLCVHAVHPESDYGEILSYLQSGDILCHCYQGKGPYSILGEDGRVLPSVWAARERGVLFDAAVGRANHSYAVIQKAFADGFYPDIISTDIVTHSAYRKNVFSLPYTIAKFLALGLPLQAVVKACTETPAALMGMAGEIGTLAPGALADLAIFKLTERPVTFQDLMGNSVDGNCLLVPQMTIKAGRIVFRQIEFTF